MFLGVALALAAQVAPTLEPAPGTTYDPAVPTLEAVVGHGFGEEVTPPADIVRYLEALATAAPDRTRLISYGDTWEGRPLHMLAISSPEYVARLDEVKAGLGRLADPRGLDDAEAEALIAELPVVVVFMHGVHGNEISSSGAALAEAYHLLAATDDRRVPTILDNVVVLVDPVENPDGRARFVSWNRQGRGAEPDPDPLAAERDEPWPGGRTNHYLFDMNRDWFIQSQPETRGRTRTLLDWHPQVVVDLHEMGRNSTYFFPPPAPPVSPWITPHQREQWDLLGASIAEAFDRRGFPYFNKENYDAFYPGYGDSWPMGHGAVAMTFEQASARGLVVERDDGTLLTYNRGVVQHFTAALTTAHTAAVHRERLLRDYVDFHRTALELDGQGVHTYVLHSKHDPAMATRLARLLARNGIEVFAPEAPIAAGARTLSVEGTFLVPVGQPAGRLVRSLLDDDVEMDEAFLERQHDRLANRQPHEMYDVTAWSLPRLFDVEAVPLARDPGVPVAPVAAEGSASGPGDLAAARVAYLLPWGTAAAAAVAEAGRAGIPVHVAGDGFRLGGREFPVGTAIVRTPELEPTRVEALARIAAAHGAQVVAANTGYVDEGISLGSRRVRALKTPRVVLAWDEPTRAYSAGWARYVLERRYGVPVTAIRAGTLPRARVSEYDVIVLPSGDYEDAFDEAFTDRLQAWMSEGGTLITLAEATRWAAGAELLETAPELRGGAPALPPGGDETGDGQREPPEQPVDYLDAIQPDREAPIVISGSLLTGVLDTEHWLSSGTDGRIGVHVDGTRIFSPITLDHGVNVGRYAEGDELVASGIVWTESRDQLMNKPFLIHQPEGEGHLVAFVEDPNYRAYTEATSLLFMNAVLMGPAF